MNLPGRRFARLEGPLKKWRKFNGGKFKWQLEGGYTRVDPMAIFVGKKKRWEDENGKGEDSYSIPAAGRRRSVSPDQERLVVSFSAGNVPTPSASLVPLSLPRASHREPSPFVAALSLLSFFFFDLPLSFFFSSFFIRSSSTSVSTSTSITTRPLPPPTLSRFRSFWKTRGFPRNFLGSVLLWLSNELVHNTFTVVIVVVAVRVERTSDRFFRTRFLNFPNLLISTEICVR